MTPPSDYRSRLEAFELSRQGRGWADGSAVEDITAALAEIDHAD